MLNSIQTLRAFAAWIVVGHHYMQLFYNFKHVGVLPDLFKNFGAIGVDLFFVISGFVIYGSIITKPKTPQIFAINRLARIAPAYWAFTALTAVAVIYMPGSVPLTSFEPLFFIKSLLFIPAQNPSGIGLYPLMTVGWTLNYEASFYAVFFAALFLPAPYRVLGLIFGVAILQAVASRLHDPISFYGNTMVWEFIFGVALAILYKRGLVTRIPTIAAALMVLGSIVVITQLGPVSHSPIRSGLPCAVILCACLSQEKFFPKHNFIARLGDWSYSTYLCHILIISFAIKINEQYTINPALMAVTVILSIILTSFASYSFIEMPATRMTKRWQKRAKEIT